MPRFSFGNDETTAARRTAALALPACVIFCAWYLGTGGGPPIARLLAGQLFLCSVLLIPGYCLVRLARFSSHSRADWVLASVSCGLAYVACTVQLAALAGFYSRPVMLSILAAPAVAALTVRLPCRLEIPKAGDTKMPGRTDLLAMGLVAVYVAFAAADCATTPITAWDGLISWDKWATDWARRTSIDGYLFGGYPQMLPIFGSLLYKLAGTGAQVLPTEVFALHSAHPLFAGVLAVAIYRIASLLKLPLWLALTVVFGSAITREIFTSGSADGMETCLFTCALALTVGYLEGRWTAGRFSPWLLGTAILAACFTKITGLWLLPGVLILWAQYRWLHREKRRGGVRLSGRALVAICIVPAGGLAPFYTQQYVLERSFDLTKLTRYEHHVSMRLAAAAVNSATERTRSPNCLRRTFQLGSEFLLYYTRRLGVAAALALLLGVFGFAGLFDTRNSGLWVLAAACSLVWFSAASYDFRNMMPVFPLWGLAVSAGLGVAARAVRRISPVCEPLTLAAGAGLALLCAYPLAAETYRIARPGITPLITRLETLAATPEERVRVFFPSAYPDLVFLRSTTLYARADVIAPFALYRFLPRGIYGMRTYAWDVSQPDVFVGVPSTIGLSAEKWTPVRGGASHIWVYEPSPKPVGTAVACDLLSKGREYLPGSSVTFRILVPNSDAAATMRTFLAPYSREVINAAGTCVTNPGLPVGKSLLYSGIVTLRNVPLSSKAGDHIWIGLEPAVPGARIGIDAVAVTVYPPDPALPPF